MYTTRDLRTKIKEVLDKADNDGAILINNQGLRFCDERQTPQREIAIAAQAGKIAYILLDEKLIARYSQWPHFISTAPEIATATSS